MSTPSMVVMNCGKALSFASAFRQSYPAPQYCTSFWNCSSWAPWDRSLTVSRSGQRVSAMRRRRSVRASSGTLTRRGRMASAAVGCAAGWAVEVVILVSFFLAAAAATGEDAARASKTTAASQAVPLDFSASMVMVDSFARALAGHRPDLAAGSRERTRVKTASQTRPTRGQMNREYAPSIAQKPPLTNVVQPATPSTTAATPAANSGFRMKQARQRPNEQAMISIARGSESNTAQAHARSFSPEVNAELAEPAIE